MNKTDWSFSENSLPKTPCPLPCGHDLCETLTSQVPKYRELAMVTDICISASTCPGSDAIDEDKVLKRDEKSDMRWWLLSCTTPDTETSECTTQRSPQQKSKHTLEHTSWVQLGNFGHTKHTRCKTRFPRPQRWTLTHRSRSLRSSIFVS